MHSFIRRALALSVLPAIAGASNGDLPLTMDIAVLAIDNYTGNGNKIPDLSFQISSGQSFYGAAENIVHEYALSKGASTPIPYKYADRRDSQVTFAAMTSNIVAHGERERADFVFFGGHGFGGALYLGDKPGYKGVTPAQLSLGDGFNRFFLANACNIFHTVGTPAIAWHGAFNGLKALLGFKSVVIDNNHSEELYNEFWLNWTWRQKSLQDAFYDAEALHGYKHLLPAAGLEPGCMSAWVEPGQLDNCRLPFMWLGDTYDPAPTSSGNFYTRVIGSPIY